MPDHCLPSLEALIKEVKHSLLVNKLLLAQLKKEPIIRFFFPHRQLLCISRLVNLFVDLLQIKIVLRWVRAASL